MCHALIIEDDYHIASYIAELIAAAGVTSVALAASHSAAIAAAQERQPAIILSDVRLVQGTGPEAVRTIVTSLGSIPVIFITASPDECDPLPDTVAVITKPVIPHVLLAAVQELVSGREAPV